jgi:transcriptional regulator with XRE-family HTH domain
MAKWRPLDDYSPFARLLVEYMWGQRPPLLPNQFAQRMGVRKQQISLWLNSDATPSASVLVRLARGMGHPVSELFIAAGYASPNDPLFDIEESWAHILTEVQSTPEFLALAEPQQIIVIGVLRAAHLRDSVRLTPVTEIGHEHPETSADDDDGVDYGVDYGVDDSNAETGDDLPHSE